MHPSKECREGRHVTTEIHSGIHRCTWCGHIERDTETLYVIPFVAPAAQPLPPLSPNLAIILEIETRFKSMAREYAATSPAIIHWRLSGNKLPRCYT